MITAMLINHFRISGALLGEKQAAETRAALQRGIELLASESVRAPTLKLVIWRLTQEAVETLRRLPDRERSWLHSNERAIWPEIARPSEECRRVEWEIAIEELLEVRERDRTPMPRFAISDPTAVDRMLVVLGWLRWLRSKNSGRDRRVFLDLASGKPPRFVKRHFYFRCSDSTVKMTKDRVLQHIAVAIRPYSNGLTFDQR